MRIVNKKYIVLTPTQARLWKFGGHVFKRLELKSLEMAQRATDERPKTGQRPETYKVVYRSQVLAHYAVTPSIVPDPNTLKDPRCKKLGWHWDDGCQCDMHLPEGKTCSDCRYSQNRDRKDGTMAEAYCSQYLGDSFNPQSILCDWAPSRFVPALVAVPQQPMSV